MRIGTLTVIGKRPMEIDGLFMGWNDCKLVFAVMLDGFKRKGKLYKTLDPEYLCQALGIKDYKWDQTVKIKP